MPGQIRDASGRLAALLVEGQEDLAEVEGRGERVPRGGDTITEEGEEEDMQVQAYGTATDIRPEIRIEAGLFL